MERVRRFYSQEQLLHGLSYSMRALYPPGRKGGNSIIGIGFRLQAFNYVEPILKPQSPILSCPI